MPRRAAKAFGSHRHEEDPDESTVLISGDRIVTVPGEGVPSTASVVPQKPLSFSKLFNVASQRRDLEMRDRHIMQLANVIVSFVLLVVVMQLQWDGQVFQQTETTFMLKAVITSLTILLELQIIESYRAGVQHRIAELLDADTDQVQNKRDQKSLKRLRLWRTAPNCGTVWWGSSMRYKLWIELLVCLPHPLPWVPVETDKALALLMLFRIYLIFPVFHDFSPIFQLRQSIRHLAGYTPAVAPNFDVSLSVRTFFRQYPISFCLIVVFMGNVFTAYGLYLYEREYQPDLFTIWGAFYLSFMCIVTNYNADAYGVLNPVTLMGQFLCITATLWGLFLLALLIDYVHTGMRPDKFEELAIQWVTRRQLDIELRQASAILIQRVWRKYQWVRNQERVSTAVSDVGTSIPNVQLLSDEAYDKQYKRFDDLILKQVRIVNKQRRTRAHMRLFARAPMLATIPAVAVAPRLPTGTEEVASVTIDGMKLRVAPGSVIDVRGDYPGSTVVADENTFVPLTNGMFTVAVGVKYVIHRPSAGNVGNDTATPRVTSDKRVATLRSDASSGKREATSEDEEGSEESGDDK